MSTPFVALLVSVGGSSQHHMIGMIESSDEVVSGELVEQMVERMLIKLYMM